MILFVKLLLAHLIGDFILQPTGWVRDKEQRRQRSPFLYAHTLLHAVLASILVWETRFIGYALVLAAVHGLIDFMKLHYQKPATQRRWFVADQFFHLLTLAGITLIYTGNPIDWQQFDDRAWLVITGILLMTRPASIVIRNLISVWTPENKEKTDDSLANAGNYIGILERLFVFCFVITGHFDAVGFLLGAKSIFRFGDLMQARERKLTEYVLIGTLLSFGMAMLAGFLVRVGLDLMR